MKRIIISLIFLIALTAPLVSSIDATVNVRAEPFHNIVLRAYNGPNGNSIFSETQKADNKGYAQFQVGTSLSKLTFYMIEVHPISNEKRDKTIEDVEVTSLIELEFDDLSTDAPQEIPVEETQTEEPQENITEETTETTLEETAKITQEPPVQQSAGTLTGFIIKDGKPAKGAYYLGSIGLLIIFSLIFIAFRLKTSIEQAKDNSEDLESELKDAERKLKEAQNEIQDIKTKRSSETKKAEEEYLKAKENYEKLTGKKDSVEEKTPEPSKDDVMYKAFQDED